MYIGRFGFLRLLECAPRLSADQTFASAQFIISGGGYVPSEPRQSHGPVQTTNSCHSQLPPLALAQGSATPLAGLVTATFPRPPFITSRQPLASTNPHPTTPLTMLIHLVRHPALSQPLLSADTIMPGRHHPLMSTVNTSPAHFPAFHAAGGEPPLLMHSGATHPCTNSAARAAGGESPPLRTPRKCRSSSGPGGHTPLSFLTFSMRYSIPA